MLLHTVAYDYILHKLHTIAYYCILLLLLHIVETLLTHVSYNMLLHGIVYCYILPHIVAHSYMLSQFSHSTPDSYILLQNMIRTDVPMHATVYYYTILHSTAYT